MVISLLRQGNIDRVKYLTILLPNTCTLCVMCLCFGEDYGYFQNTINYQMWNDDAQTFNSFHESVK